MLCKNQIISVLWQLIAIYKFIIRVLIFSSRICQSCFKTQYEIKTPWPESASELYRLSDRHLSAKLVPTFADRGCHVVSITDPSSRILDFLDQSRYFFFQVAPHLYSWGWVDPVPDPLLLRKSGSAGNRTRINGSVARNSWQLDHRGSPELSRTLSKL
jgi:hypothetical protein